MLSALWSFFLICADSTLHNLSCFLFFSLLFSPLFFCCSVRLRFLLNLHFICWFFFPFSCQPYFCRLLLWNMIIWFRHRECAPRKCKQNWKPRWTTKAKIIENNVIMRTKLHFKKKENGSWQKIGAKNFCFPLPLFAERMTELNRITLRCSLSFEKTRSHTQRGGAEEEKGKCYHHHFFMPWKIL